MCVNIKGMNSTSSMLLISQFLQVHLCLYVELCRCLQWIETVCVADKESLPLGAGTAAGSAFFWADSAQGTVLRSYRASWTVITCLCEDKGHER